MIGFGLCDGARALALYGDEAGLDGLILANPWLVEVEEGPRPRRDPRPLPQAAAELGRLEAAADRGGQFQEVMGRHSQTVLAQEAGEPVERRRPGACSATACRRR